MSEKEALQTELHKLEQEHIQLGAAKTQEEAGRKTAEESTRLMTEGYEQLEKTIEELQANVIELQTDNEQLVRERNNMRHEIESSKGTRAAFSPTRPKDKPAPAIAEVTLPATKIKRELQHLDSTITVLEKSLADANAKKCKAQEKKDKVDVEVLELETQLKAL